MASVLFLIGGAVINALAFSDMVKKNIKDMIWHWKSFRGSEANGIKIE